jgi:hypothetical protein
MHKKLSRMTSVVFLFIMIFFSVNGLVDVQAQQLTPVIPTAAMATVTGTPTGPYITVNADQDQINVRECPNTTTCSIIGVLLPGETRPAKGRSPGGEWIMIEYPFPPNGVAWVHSSLVTVSQGFLNVIEPPATPTPLVTATVDPTLAAQFIVTAVPTRLPTFTQPAPLDIPTLIPEVNPGIVPNVPMGMVIAVLAALGIFGGFISLIRGK